MSKIKQLGRSAFYSLVRFLPLRLRREVIYFRSHRRWPSTKNPRSFTEKVHWRILFDRRDILKFTCDKEATKQHVARMNLDLRVPQTYWMGTQLEEITSLNLDRPWILKRNHANGDVVIGSGPIDAGLLRRQTSGWLRRFNSDHLGEWAYQFARPTYILEELIGTETTELEDYKFYVFDGEVKLIHVDHARRNAHTRRFYTPDWEPLEVRKVKSLAPIQPAPEQLTKMLSLASAIGMGYDFMRVDLYLNDGVVWLGEMSPYPAGATGPFHPRSFDNKLGSYWKLPDQP